MAVSAPVDVGRGRRRKNVVGNSPNREEYVRLMKAGWTSIALERYAMYRYGEDVPASTIRTYRNRLGIKIEPTFSVERVDPEAMIDPLRSRAELIQLQQARIRIDVKHEQDMGKLFGSTKAEIRELANLLTEHKSDLQDMGLFPKAGEKLEITHPDQVGSGSLVPRMQTLGELFGTDDDAQVISMARKLHEREKGTG